MKVKVRSLYREVLASTGRVWDEEGNDHLQFRQFSPPVISMRDGVPRYAPYGEAWMTPEEALFLVESSENQQTALAGLEQEYYYPLGHPVPRPNDADGHALLPPITGKTMHVSDDRQTTAAQQIFAERDAALAKHKARKATEATATEETAEQRKERQREAREQAKLVSASS